MHTEPCKVHNEQCNDVKKGGLVVPEDSNNKQEYVSAGACKKAEGISFSEGIAFNNNDLDSIMGVSQLLKLGLLIFSIFLFYYILLYITYITVLLKVVGRFYIP